MIAPRHPACAVKSLRTQRRTFRAPERELSKAEYCRLLAAAEERQSWRLADLLGHSGVETTRIYTMTSGAEQAARLGTLGSLDLHRMRTWRPCVNCLASS